MTRQIDPGATPGIVRFYTDERGFVRATDGELTTGQCTDRRSAARQMRLLIVEAQFGTISTDCSEEGAEVLMEAYRGIDADALFRSLVGRSALKGQTTLEAWA